MSTVKPWCDEHEPIQYRDGLPPKCANCGFDHNGRAWIHRPGTFKPLLAAVAEGVEPSEAELEDLAFAGEVIRERTAEWVKVIHRESGWRA